MTELEARDLKVGDMILYCDGPGFDKHFHVYAEEVQGEMCGVDMGLVLENDGEFVSIDWLSKDDNNGFFIGTQPHIWGHVEKV